MKKISFLISLLLLIAVVAPAQAAVDTWGKYTYKYYVGNNDPIYTGAGDILIEDLNIEHNEATYKQVYYYDVVKLNKQGVKATKQLNNGLSELVHYDGKAYVLFFNYVKKQLEVYDEDFVLVDTEPFNLYSEGSISIYQADHYIRYSTHVWGENTNGSATSLIYDLKQQKLVEDVSLPTVSYEVGWDADSGTEEILYLDALNQQNKTLSVASIVDFEGFVQYEVFEHEDTLTFLYKSYTDLGSKTNLYTISKEGTVLYNVELPSTSDDWYATQKNDALYLQGISYSYEYAVYNIHTKTLKTKEPEHSIFKQTELNSDYFAEEIQNDDSSAIVVKNQGNQEIYTINDAYMDRLILEQYFTIVKYNPEGGRITQVIETATGNVVKEYINYTSIYKLPNESLYAVEMQWNEERNEQEVTGEVLQLNPSTHPTTYQPNKTWTVEFTTDVDASSVNLESIYVKNAQGMKMRTTSKVEGNKVRIVAPAEGYVSGETYTLYVEPIVKSSKGIVLKAGQTKTFTIE